MKIIFTRAMVILSLASLMTFSANVHAQEKSQVSVTYYPASIIGVAAGVPFLTTQDVTHSVRAGLTYAFSGMPAVNATWVMSGPREGRVWSYVGAGVGVAFPEAPVINPSLSSHVLAGVNVAVAGGFSVFGEVTVAGNGFGSRLGFGLGGSYELGGSN